MRPYTILNAVKTRNATSVKNRLAMGDSPDAVDNSGYPILLTAIGNGDYAIALTLIEAGADPNLSWEGMTPLMMAVRRDQPKLVEALLGAGAKTDGRCWEGKTAADYVHPAGRCFKLKHLLEA